MGVEKNHIKADKINLIEGDVWSKGGNSITIIKCYDEHKIVEVQLSSSLTSKEYPMRQIKTAIITEKLKKQSVAQS